MTYQWFKICNVERLVNSGLPYIERSFIFPVHGEKKIMITYGSRISVMIDDVFLTPGINGKNPLIFDGYGAYLEGNWNLWIAIGVPDEN